MNPSEIALMNQMRVDLERVTAELHASKQQQMVQQQQLQALQAQGALAPLSSAPLAPRSNKPRIALPSVYDGDAAKLDNWDRELQQQFTYYSTPEEERVPMGAAYLRSVALDWWSSIPPAERPTHWVAFIAALRSRFQPLTTATLARRQLDNLRQGPNQGVNEYIAAFRRLLVPLPEMHENDRLHVFVRGLRPAVANQVLLQRAASLDKAIEIASFVGGVASGPGGAFPASSAASAGMDLSALSLAGIEGLEAETPGSCSSSAVPEVTLLRQELNALRAAMQQSHSNPKPSNQGPRPAGGRPLPRLPHLTPDQVKRYMDANMCFGCRSTAHRYPSCPRRNNPLPGN